MVCTLSLPLKAQICIKCTKMSKSGCLPGNIRLPALIGRQTYKSNAPINQCLTYSLFTKRQSFDDFWSWCKQLKSL